MLDELGVAGIECQLLLLLKHLDRAQVQPYLCLLRGQGEHSQKFVELDGRPVLRLEVGSLLRPSTLPKAMRFARFLRRERIDVLHPLFHDSLYFGAPVAKLAGVPCVVRFRVDLNYWMKLHDRWVSRILSSLLDATVANCEACKQAAIRDEWAPPESVKIIPNGLDLSRFPESPKVRIETEAALETRVGVVANLRPVKNLALFIRAAELLQASHPNARFLIAGEGDSRNDLEARIRQSRLQDRCELLGAIANVPEFLRTLDVAVLCSDSEGSPNSIMEYMAAACPLVSTNVGGCGELIQHEEHGLLVDSNDAEKLAAAIDRLLRDRDLAMRLGTNARQRALAEYGIDLQARRYEYCYRDLLARKRKRGRFLDTGARSDSTHNPHATRSAS